MDKKIFGIGILSLMAIVLMVANFMPLRTAAAADSLKDRDFSFATSAVTQGGDALYVVDNRGGQMAIFLWDPTTRTIKLRDVQPVSQAFQ